jgi:hypothetical protein
MDAPVIRPDILIACVILFGIGVLTAVTRTRQKDPPA